MKTKMKGNNKGFSLVELIVVMAIMAILAVTLAPRLMQYVEKANRASDQEAVSTIFTAAKLAYAQNMGEFSGTGKVTSGNDLILGAKNATGTKDTTFFNIDDAGKTWSVSTTYVDTTFKTNGFVQEMKSILKGFTLKSKDVGENTNIKLTISDNKVSVKLDYDTTDTDGSDTDKAKSIVLSE